MGKSRVTIGDRSNSATSNGASLLTSKFQWSLRTIQSTTFEQLTPSAAEMILGQLPERIQKAFVQRAAEIDYPLEAVLEMAMAGYLDREAKRKRNESRSHL
jgi:hypothetical protein